MANFIKRLPATVRNLFILIREGWPTEACSKKMVKFMKRWTDKYLVIFAPPPLPKGLEALESSMFLKLLNVLEGGELASHSLQ